MHLIDCQPNFGMVEVGRYYLTRDGHLVGPMEHSCGDKFAGKIFLRVERQTDSNPLLWGSKGKWLWMCDTKSPFDFAWLVPESKTMAPIAYRPPRPGDEAFFVARHDFPALGSYLRYEQMAKDDVLSRTLEFECGMDTYGGNRVIIASKPLFSPVSDTWDLI